MDLEYNIKTHNKVAVYYDKNHPEIYNPIEQKRLSKALSFAYSNLSVIDSVPTVLDYGCGAGNLTSHLINLGCKVISADISQKFLDLIKTRYTDNKLHGVFKLNGNDLSEIDSESIDMIAVYSVLHHIPDYLTAVKDMIRVLKPGGILFLDHERSPDSWNGNKYYDELQNLTKKGINPLILLNLLDPKWYIRKYQKLKNPRWQSEGDIHVWKNDHIEWELIEQLALDQKMKIIKQEDYLLAQPQYGELYERFADLCADMRLFVAVK